MNLSLTLRNYMDQTQNNVNGFYSGRFFSHEKNAKQISLIWILCFEIDRGEEVSDKRKHYWRSWSVVETQVIVTLASSLEGLGGSFPGVILQ
jgi:hypothetical protein